MFGRLLKLSLTGQDGAEVVMRFCEVRFKLECLEELRPGLVEVPLFDQGVSQIVLRLGVIGI